MLISIIRAKRAQRALPRWAQYMLMFSIFSMVASFLLLQAGSNTMLIWIFPPYGMFLSIFLAAEVIWLVWVPFLAGAVFWICLLVLNNGQPIKFGEDIALSLILAFSVALGAVHFSTTNRIEKGARELAATCQFVKPPLTSLFQYLTRTVRYPHAWNDTDQGKMA